MKRSVLVHVYHPGNALGAMCSVLWHGQSQNLPPAEVTVLLVNPYTGQDALQHMAGIMTSLCDGQGWPRPVVLSSADMSEILAGEDPAEEAACRRFRQTLGRERFDEVHYVHEVAGPLVQLALNAYPDAHAVTFGDALGSLNNAAYHRALYDGCPPGERVAAGREYARKALRGDMPQARTVVALLPTDQTGDCLEGKRLLVVPREIALSVIASSRAGIADLEAHCVELVGRTPEPRFLCLMENVDESCFATPENALALQEEIIVRAAPPGAGIILKPHPMSTTDLHLELARRLEGRYSPVCLDTRFQRYPVEFMLPLLENCRPVCWSYGTLSLSFLTGVTLRHAIDEDLVKRYMHPERWDSMLNSMRLVTEPLARLASWDRSGALWAGGYETAGGAS